MAEQTLTVDEADVIRLVAWAAALSFNNWILGAIFNRRLLAAGGSISEFSAATQPLHGLFRSLDILSGSLFVGAAALASYWLRDWRRWRVIIISTAVLGAANILDALLPLPCSYTLNSSCSVSDHLATRHFILPDHLISSFFIGLTFFLIPAAGWLYSRRFHLERLRFFSVVTLFFFFVFVACFFANLATDNDSINRADSASQMLHMLVSCAYIAYFFRVITRQGDFRHAG